MKKIVALVLSLVMVLGLASTAFGAITLWTENNEYTAECDIFEAAYNTKVDGPVTVKFIPGKDVTYNTDGTVKQIGIIPHYVIEEVVEEDVEGETPAVFAARPGLVASTYDVKFVDEAGNEIADATEVTLNNMAVFFYGAAAIAKNTLGEDGMAVEGYTYKESSVNGLEITFVYSRDTVYYTLTVNYVKVSGEALDESFVSEALVEESEYTTEAKVFKGWKLHEVTGDAAEGIMDSDKVVNYVYAPVSTPVTTVIQRYVRVDSIPADADASQYILVKAHDPKVIAGQTSKDAYYILKKVEYVNYFAKADEFKAWSDDCEAYPAPKNADTVKYYTVANKVKGIFDDVSVKFAATEQGAPVLVGKEVVMLNTRSTVSATQHTWMASKWNEKDAPIEFTCQACKTVGTVINSPVNAPAGAKIDNVGGILIAYNYVKAPAEGVIVESAKTFDAGIAMSIGVSVMAVAGSAVLLKKKED